MVNAFKIPSSDWCWSVGLGLFFLFGFGFLIFFNYCHDFVCSTQIREGKEEGTVPVPGVNIQVESYRLAYAFEQRWAVSQQLIMPLLREVQATGPVTTSHPRPAGVSGTAPPKCASHMLTFCKIAEFKGEILSSSQAWRNGSHCPAQGNIFGTKLSLKVLGDSF